MQQVGFMIMIWEGNESEIWRRNARDNTISVSYE
jgi:hypothetical protein